MFIKGGLKATADEDLITELKSMDETAIEDALYRELSFGTVGLRGTIDAAMNRMDVYTVAKARQELANYLGVGASVVVCYDTRIKSDMFAKVVAGEFKANGIKMFLWLGRYRFQL